MIDSSSDFARHLAELKTAFDESFALPPPQPKTDWLEFAMIVAGGNRYALPMSQLAGVAVNRKIVPVPAERPGLLGLSAIQGQLVPVFDLAALLGAGTGGAAPRWIALYRVTELVGLAFEHFEGARRVAAQAVDALASASEQAQVSRQAIQVDTGLIHLLDLASIVSILSSSKRRAVKTIN